MEIRRNRDREIYPQMPQWPELSQSDTGVKSFVYVSHMGAAAQGLSNLAFPDYKQGAGVEEMQMDTDQYP